VNDTSNFNVKSDDEAEISLADIVELIQEIWKQLILAGVVGAVLGFGGWFFLGSYQAELVLINNTNTNTNTNTTINTTINTNINTNNFGLDLLSWRILQKNLPNLAYQLVINDKLAQDQKGIYKSMSDFQWWSKNVIANYAFSKTDAKDFPKINQDFDGFVFKIQSFTILAGGQSQESSLNNARLASQFLQSGGAYLQIKALINSYEGDVLGTASTIQNQLTKTQVDQIYFKERIKTLEELLKRFPNRGSINSQFLDPKENSSKYLPVENQLIAANNDLNQSKEIFNHLNDRLVQIKLMAKFIALALPQIEAEPNGLLLVKSLLAVEQDLRKGLAPDDLKGYLALDQLRSQLLTIESRFTKGLEANTPPISKKMGPGPLQSIAGGAVITGFLMLAFLLGRKIFKNLKSTTQS
jgi:hypothetical protein